MFQLLEPMFQQLEPMFQQLEPMFRVFAIASVIGYFLRILVLLFFQKNLQICPPIGLLDSDFFAILIYRGPFSKKK